MPNEENIQPELQAEEQKAAPESKDDGIEVTGEIIAPKKTLSPEEAALRIKKLSDENKEWRKEQREHKRLLEETQKQLQEMNTKSQERLVNAELKVIAAKLKLRDFNDAKKLADLSAVKVLDTGDVTGVEEAISALKKEKPYLFDLATTTNITNLPFRTQETPEKNISSMSASDFAKAKAALLGKRT